MGTRGANLLIFPPALSRFGPAAIDRVVNQRLLEQVPVTARTAVFDLKLTGRGGKKVVTTVVAANAGRFWGRVDLGGALGGAIDLDNPDDYEVELVMKAVW